MCGRYWMDADNEEMQQIIARMQHMDAPVKTEGEIFPGDRVVSICRSRAGTVKAFPMEWGFRMPDGRRIINARSETAAEKPMFAQSMQERRCLLPMNAYFEWENTAAGKRKYRISPETKGLHYLAGIYRMEESGPVCTVLTMEAADEIAFIHSRMPVILNEAQKEAWLSGQDWDFAQNEPMIHECTDGQLRFEF